MQKLISYLKNNKKHIGTHAGMILATVCLVTVVFCFWGRYKIIWFCDEIYSYFTANSGQGVGARITYDTWYDSQFVVDDMTAECGRFYSRTINNVKADDHPPIYFLTMHTASLIMRGSISKWVGLSINLICVIGIGILVYLLIYLITQRKLIALLSALALAVVPSFITNAMLIRMYCMMTAWAVLYVFLSYLIAYHKMSRLVKAAAYLALSVTTTCGFLTQYYFAIFAVGFTLVYSVCCLVQKQWRDMFSYVLSMILAVGLATFFWSNWIDQIFYRYCGEEVLSQAADFSKMGQDLIVGLTYIPKLIFYKWYIAGIVISLLCLGFLIYKKDKFIAVILQLLGGSFFYSIIVAHVTPEYYLDYRYFYMATAVVYIALLIIYFRCLSYIPNEVVKKYGAYVILVFLLVFHVITAFADEMAVGYVDRTGGYNEKYREISQYSDLPWIVYGFENWTMMDTYYNLALGTRFCVYCDWTNFDETKCVGEGEDFLFFYNNSFEYEEDEVVERLKNAQGCRHEVEELCGEGSSVYYIHHK